MFKRKLSRMEMGKSHYKGINSIERKGHTCVITENPHQMIIYGGII